MGLSTKQILKLAECLNDDSAPQCDGVNHGWCIVVLDRGFVYVGDVVTDDSWCTITNGKNIRSWGTKNGLGQLAISGPQPETKLDPVETVKAPIRALISIIKCRTRWS